MKIVNLLFSTLIFIMGNISAQELSSSGKRETRKIINNKKFHVQYQEVTINKTIEEVWAEVAGNFANGADIAKSLISSRSLSENKTGLGAKRYLNIDFNGKPLEVKEHIIDFKECDTHCEFTYYVYESIGTPLKVDTYFTWVLRKGDNGQTHLGTYFIYRAKPNFLTGIVGKQLAKSGSLRTGVLVYKHYLETGEKRVNPEKLNKLYPTN
jgi:hypothetical protein